MFGIDVLERKTSSGALSRHRLASHVAPAADQLALWFAPGVLFTVVVETLARVGLNHAGLQIFDGDLAEAYYQVATPDPTGEKLVAYGPPIHLPGGARIVMASATLGRTAENKPILHCHGVLRDRQGRLHGGHLPTDLCVIGEEGVPAWAGASLDGGFVLRPDAETGLSLLVPEGNEA